MAVVLGSVEYLYLKESAMEDKLVQSLIAAKLVSMMGTMGLAFSSADQRVRHANNCIKACLDAAVIMRVALLDKDSDADEPSKPLVEMGSKLSVIFEDLFRDKKPGDFSKN